MMVSFKIKEEKNGYRIIEPMNDLHKSFGYLMALNPHKEVLKFYNRRLFYGCFRREAEAKRMVELLMECGWDYSRRDELKERVLSEVEG